MTKAVLFPTSLEHNLSNIFSTAGKVSRLIKSLDCKIAAGSDKTVVAVLENINPQLTSILTKFLTAA